MGNEMEMLELVADLMFGDTAESITELLPTMRVIAILILVVSAIIVVAGTVFLRRAVRGASKTLDSESRGTYEGRGTYQGRGTYRKM